jgi:uncharacterized protein (DUF885 family)
MSNGKTWIRLTALRGVPAAATLLFGVPAIAQSSIGYPTDWAALERDYIALTHRQDPLRAGGRGDRAALARWPDDSQDALAARKTELLSLRARLRALPAAMLSHQNELSRTVMARQIDTSLGSLDFDEARLAFQTGQGFFTLPDTQAAVTTLEGESDAQAWLARMVAIPSYFATETQNLQRGIDTHFTQPALVTRAAIEALEKAVSLPSSQSPLLLPFATLPDSVSPARRAELTAQADEIIDSRVRPAQQRLIAFLRTRYLPKARPEPGISSVPQGKRYYEYVVQRETTTSLTVQAIHRLGLDEVARIRADMQAVMTQTGYQGDLRAFSAKLKAEPRNYAVDVDDYAAKAAEIAKRIDYLLPRYFGLLPRLTYGVRAKPPALESTSDGYLPGSPDSGQAGAVVYSAADVQRTPLYSLPAWLLHEGVPGHHLQIALAEENTRLPEYRRNDDITAYVEGWALYAERLGEDMGIYRTPEEHFGRLSMEMWRACRLVMDTGIHAMNWTRDQAANCLRDNTAMTESSISYEVDRYIGWPAQALGYKMGELRIEQLRRDAEQKLGPAFDLRRFHDVILAEGALPMDLLQQQVDAWIAERETSSR